MNYARFLNAVALRRKPSILRQLANILYNSPPDLIFLGAGLPNPKTFPFKEAVVTTHDGLTIKVSEEKMAVALQYLPTPGYPGLLKQLKELQLKVHNPPLWDERDILITTGGQNGLYFVIEAILSEGDPIVVPDPVYPGLVLITNIYNPHYLSVGEDADGMRPDLLYKLLSEWKATGKPQPKLLYVSPTGGNPTGSCIPLERKKKIYSIASEFDLIILEDDPYYFVHFEDELTPSFLSMDVEGRVVRFDSFSKILSSGLRLGYTTAPKPIIQIIQYSMQAAFLHTSSLAQCLASELLEQWGHSGLMEHIAKIQQFYKIRRDVMLEAADTHLKGLAEWNVPKAGMFIWIKVNGVDNTYKMIMEKGLKKKVLLAPGSGFLVDTSKPSPYLRASFSFASPEDVQIAFSRLAELIREEQLEQKEGQSNGNA